MWFLISLQRSDTILTKIPVKTNSYCIPQPYFSRFILYMIFTSKNNSRRDFFLEYVLPFFLVLLMGNAGAQIPDTTSLEPEQTIESTNRVESDSLAPAETQIDFKKKEKFQPVPRKALLYSIIPGGGQIYNRRWWKLPFVYGALGTTVYFISTNTQAYRRYRDAIRIREDGNDMTKDEFTNDDCVQLITTEQMRAFRDVKRKDMETSYIFFFIAYTLTSLEAFVDAHLQTFDVSDDLSLSIKPSIQQVGPAPYPGVGIRLQLKPRTAPELPVSF